MVLPPGAVVVIFKPHQLGYALYLEACLINETEIFDHGTLNLCFVLCSGTFGVYNSPTSLHLDTRSQHQRWRGQLIVQLRNQVRHVHDIP